MAEAQNDPTTGEPRKPGSAFFGEGDLDPMAAGTTLLRKGGDLLKQREQAGKEQESALAKKQEAESPYQQKLKDILDDKVTAHAELKKLQAAPNPADYKKYTMEFLGAMTLVGAFAGRKSRNTGNAALKAFTGAMNGWHEGNLEAYAQATKQWEENAKATIQNNSVELQRYQEIIQNKALNIEQMKAGLLLAGLASGNANMVAQAKANNIDAMFKIVDMISRLQERTQGAVDPLMQYNKQNAEMYAAHVNDLNAHPDRLANVKYEDFVRLKAQSEAFRKYDPNLPELKDPGQNAAFAQTGGQPRTTLPMLIKGFQEQNGRYPTPEEIRKLGADYAGDVSMARTAGTQAARVESATNEVAALVPQALETSRALPRTKFVPLNKAIQAWEAGTSDPIYNDFVIANFSLMNAYARAMNPSGQPRVTERFEAKATGILNQATDQKSYEVQLRRLWKEVQASKGAVAKTRSGETGAEEFPEPTAPAAGDGGWGELKVH